MTDVRLYREPSTDEGTRGILLFDDTYIHAIELPDRDNLSNRSRIPAGRYSVSVRNSPRYGRVYHVDSVPGRTHVLLHHGNYAGDKEKGLRTHSAGCILLGSKRGVLNGQRAVLSSRSARRKFELTMNWEPFTLEIIDGIS
jgi:hypothetical protein